MVKLLRLETREKTTRDNDERKGTILYQNEKLEVLVTEVDQKNRKS